jgi:hypothetical protein
MPGEERRVLIDDRAMEVPVPFGVRLVGRVAVMSISETGNGLLVASESEECGAEDVDAEIGVGAVSRESAVPSLGEEQGKSVVFPYLRRGVRDRPGLEPVVAPLSEEHVGEREGRPAYRVGRDAPMVGLVKGDVSRHSKETVEHDLDRIAPFFCEIVGDEDAEHGGRFIPR